MKCLIKCALSLLLAAILLTACGNAPASSADTPSAGETTPTTAEPTAKELTPVGNMLRHMSFNILGTDGLPRIDDPEKSANIKAIIQQIDPDTFGVEETAQVWTDGLVELLEGKYAVVGGHSDPKVERTANWMNALYYKVDKFDCLDSGAWYLSGDDDGKYVSGQPGNTCSFALLERKEDGALILLLNMHLQWLPLGSEDLEAHNFQYYGIATSDSNISRDNQVVRAAQLGQAYSEKYAVQYGKPVATLIGGDYNIDALKDALYDHEYTRMSENMARFGFTESAFSARELITNQSTENWVTYRRSASRLDYIFVSETVLSQTFTVGKIDVDYTISSDHLPVYLDYYIGQ